MFDILTATKQPTEKFGSEEKKKAVTGHLKLELWVCTGNTGVVYLFSLTHSDIISRQIRWFLSLHTFKCKTPMKPTHLIIFLTHHSFTFILSACITHFPFDSQRHLMGSVQYRLFPFHSWRKLRSNGLFAPNWQMEKYRPSQKKRWSCSAGARRSQELKFCWEGEQQGCKLC